MSSPNYGDEQLTQQTLDMFESGKMDERRLLEAMTELSRRIDEVPNMEGPITIYLGGDAAGVFNNVRDHSVGGLCFLVSTPLERSDIARVVSSLEVGSVLRELLESRAQLQRMMDGVPQIIQTLVSDAANFPPVFISPSLKVIIPRWQISYAVKMYELAFDNHGDSKLNLLPDFIISYMVATTSRPHASPTCLECLILESSVQSHVQALGKEGKYVPVLRSVFDRVNHECEKRYHIKPILFEDFEQKES